MDTENGIRPQTFAEFTGQYQAKAVLQTAVLAARQRGDVLAHVLLSGPAGLGKTTLAGIVAREMGSALKIVSAPSLENVIPLLRGLQPRDVLFVDEIHGLSRNLEEQFYSAMEDFRLDLQFGSRVRSIPLNKFTMIAATTRPGSLSAPLRNRFGLSLRLDFYGASELSEIVKRSARVLGVAITDDAAYTLAAASRGTPRIANALLRVARDLAQVRGSTIITLDAARAALCSLGIDANGLDSMDKRLLRALAANGKPIGLQQIAATLNEETATVETMEGFLLNAGLIQRTARGRVLTPTGAMLT